MTRSGLEPKGSCSVIYGDPVARACRLHAATSVLGKGAYGPGRPREAISATFALGVAITLRVSALR